MAEDVCRMVVSGRLTKDVEIKYTASGFPLGAMSLASNRRVKKNGEWIEETSYYELVQWGKRAESLQPYLKKGQQVLIDGQPKQERWETDGNKRSKVIIEITHIQLIGSNNKSNDGHKQESPSYPTQQATPTEKFDEDIPF